MHKEICIYRGDIFHFFPRVFFLFWTRIANYLYSQSGVPEGRKCFNTECFFFNHSFCMFHFPCFTFFFWAPSFWVKDLIFRTDEKKQKEDNIPARKISIPPFFSLLLVYFVMHIYMEKNLCLSNPEVFIRRVKFLPKGEVDLNGS